MAKKRFLRRLASDYHLWVVYITGIGFLLWHLLHGTLHWISREPPEHGLLWLTLFGILTITADRIWETEETKERVEEITTKLSKVWQASFDRRVALRSRPLESEDYAYLWGGYTGSYRVYNPSYRVDNQVKEDEIVNILVDRYRDPNFEEARYLFLTGDDGGREDLMRFSKLMKRVQKHCPNVHKKVLVKEIKTEESSSASEMYLGTRYGKYRAVLELKAPGMHSEHGMLKAPGMHSEHGMPEHYLVIDDDELVKHYLRAHFQPAWESEDAKDRNVFA